MQSIPPVRPIDPGARPPPSTETPLAERAPRTLARRACALGLQVVARNLRPCSRGLDVEVLFPVRPCSCALAKLLPRHGELKVSVGETRVARHRLLEILGGRLSLASFEHHVA